jgi:hypothetical protein
MQKLIIFITVTICYSKLIGVMELNRHGARTPSEYTELSNDLFYKSNYNHLTLNGYNQEHYLGIFIKDRYTTQNPLLSKTFIPEEHMFISSPVTRTIFSATSFIQGMYPEVIVNPIWENNPTLRKNDLPPFKNTNMNFTKADLIILDKDDDKLFHAAKCKLSGEEIKSKLPKTVVVNITEEDIKLAIDDIKKNIPELFTQHSEAEIYTFAFLEKMCGFVFPVTHHYESIYPLKNETFAILRKAQISKMYSRRIKETELSRIIISPFYDRVKRIVDMFLIPDNKLKFVLFSGHDSNLMDIWVSLFDNNYLRSRLTIDDENYFFIMPKFASSLVLELHSLGGNLKSEKFVRVVFNGEVLTEGFKAELSFDRELKAIPYGKFIKFITNTIDSTYLDIVCKDQTDDSFARSE